MNIFEAMEYGPIVASNEELGLFVTANGSYLNLWVLNGQELTNTDCRSFDDAQDLPNGIMSLSLLEVTNRAEAYLNEAMNEGSEE